MRRLDTPVLSDAELEALRNDIAFWVELQDEQLYEWACETVELAAEEGSLPP